MAALMLSMVWHGSAQNANDSTQQLEGIEISAARIQTPFSQSARSISILTQREIQELPVQNVAEVLNFIPGIDIRQRGPQGVQADVGIRGGSFDQTLVLINGVRMSDPQTGHHMLNLVVQPEQIERIEVLKGPGTRIYGPNAFAGAINIITKPGEKKGVSGTLSGGQHGLYHTNLAVHLPIGAWQQTLAVGLTGSEGYRYNTDFRMRNVFYDGAMQQGNNRFYAMAGLNQRVFGANGFYASESFTEQYEETQTLFGAAGWKKSVGAWRSDLRAYFRQHKDDYFFIRANPSVFHNDHQTRVGGVEWNASAAGTLGTAGFGAEYRVENISSSNLGNHQRHIAGAYADYRLKGAKWQLTPGLYLNGISDYGWRLYPGVDLAVFPAKGLNVFGSLAQSFRIPTYTDLYYIGPSNIGNPALQPEQAWTYELGARYFYKHWLVNAAFFARNASRIIEWVRPDASTPWQANNFIALVTQGVEAEVQYAPAKGWIRMLKFGYTYIDAGFNILQGFESRYILENLRHQYVATLALQLPYQFKASLGLRVFERMNKAETFGVCDIQLERPIHKNGSLFLQTTNLFNTPYREIGTVPMPGRWIRGGLRFHF